jgi:membrane protease subunit (stomatin/prohibitin family)
VGILSFIKSQFIEVIEWTDDSRDTMVYQFPIQGKEIKMGAQLTVRPSQAAVFVNEGQIADVFGPGRYELSTQNLPVLTKLKAWKYGFNSPFKAEVYFVNTRQFTDQKWGTMNPIMMRDAEFGMLRLRAYGIYSFRVDDPGKFMTEAFGTSAFFTVDGIAGQLKRSIVSGISDLLGEFKKPALDLAMYYDELSADACAKVQSRFNSFGLKIESLYIENISLPEEVEKALDQRTSMGVIGSMGTYTQYQAAQAIRDAAQNEGGGLAGAGVGLGAGAALGSAFASAMNAPQQGAAAMAVCPHCGAQAQQGVKFCPGCGKPMSPPAVKCPQCGKDVDAGSKFCPHCGASLQGGKCPGCGKDVGAGAKFCPDCGAKL